MGVLDAISVRVARFRRHTEMAARRGVGRTQKTARRLIERTAPTRRLIAWATTAWQYTPPAEIRTCPACAARSLRLLDPMPVDHRLVGTHTGFLTGCRTCGLLFANPLPTADQLRHFYSASGRWAEGRSEREERPPRERVKAGPRSGSAKKMTPDYLVDAILPLMSQTASRGTRALDFGCGDGKLLNALQDRGWDTYGLEPSGRAAFARHHEVTGLPRVPTFDLIVLHHVLEHVPAPLALLRQLSACLQEGGTMFVSVPRLDTLPVHGDLSYCVNGRTHLSAFSEVCLRGLMVRAGLETVARLDDPHLDAVVSRGVPLRLRLVARKTRHTAALSSDPLRAALVALRDYRASRMDRRDRILRLLPVRFRAAAIDRPRASRRSAIRNAHST